MNIRLLTEAKSMDLSRYNDEPDISQSLTIGDKKRTFEFYCFKDDKAALPSLTMGFVWESTDNGQGQKNFGLEVVAGTKKIFLKLDESGFPQGTFKIYEEMLGEDIRIRPSKPGDAGREFFISKEIKHHSGGKTIIEFNNPEGKELEISETLYRWNTHVTVYYNGKSKTHDVKARHYTITPENFMNEEWELTRSTYKDPKDYEAFVVPPPAKNTPSDGYSSSRFYQPTRIEKKREPIQSIGDHPIPTPEDLNKVFGIEGLVKDIQRGNSGYGYSVTINLNKHYPFYQYKNLVENFLSDILGAKLSEDGPNPTITIPKNSESFTQFIETCDAHKKTLIHQFSHLH